MTYTPPPGANEADIRQLLEKATEQSFRYSGAGSFVAQYQAVLSRIDRYGTNLLIPNHEVAGLTFITRPKLNFTTTSLRQDDLLATLDTIDITSMPFTIRCLLDTNYARRQDIRPYSNAAPLLDNRLPFITPLTNCLMSISGWPDFVVDTETTEGGFDQEDQTFVKGSDMLNRTYDLSLTFREVQGGFIMALFLYWEWFMTLAAKGITFPYPEDIAARRLCYTCSIYRFVLDPSRRFITKWAKATGCYPVGLPIGNSFNIGERESYLSANHQFTINFKANHIDYMRPIIFREFNTVMERFAGKNYHQGKVAVNNKAQYNFMGLPRINIEQGFNELQFFCDEQELVDPIQPQLDSLSQKVNAAYSQMYQDALDQQRNEVNQIRNGVYDAISPNRL